MKILVAIGSLSVLLGAAACSSSSSPAPTGPTAPSATDAGVGTVAEEDAATSTPPTPECAPPPSASRCRNEGSWVRGIARFDPAHFSGSGKPILRVALRHSFALVAGEDKIGGRLHAYKSFPIKDVAAGRVAFAIDMCTFGQMWTEENDPFHLVLHIDENQNNDLDGVMSNTEAVRVATPDPGELVKVTRIDVSCHAPSTCLEVMLDCEDGTACTTIEPIKSCTKRDPSCPSDDSFCK